MEHEPQIEKIIKELIEVLKTEFPDFHGIYLFGSRARGDFSMSSDYDIAIIWNGDINRQLKDRIISIIYDYELKFDIFLDTHIFSYNDILYPSTPLRMNIKTEGSFHGV